jgi:hypothetical protein
MRDTYLLRFDKKEDITQEKRVYRHQPKQVAEKPTSQAQG